MGFVGWTGCWFVVGYCVGSGGVEPFLWLVMTM